MFNPSAVDPGNTKAYNAYLTRTTGRQPYRMLPGVDSSSQVGQHLLSAFYDAVTVDAPASGPAGNALRSPGVPDKWGRLLNLLGCPHNPLGVPPFHVLESAKQLGAMGEAVPLQTLDAPARARLRRLLLIFVGDGGPQPVHLQRGVSLGVPTMSKSIVDAWRIVTTWLDNWHDIAKLLQNRDTRTLSHRYGIVNMFYVAYRQQADNVKVIDGESIAKKRLVIDWMHRILYADRRLPSTVPDTPVRDRFVACRARKLNASGLAISWTCRILAASIQAYWDQHFQFLKHHPTRVEIQRKLQSFPSFRFRDFENHDVWIPPAVRDGLFDREAELFGHFWSGLHRAVARGPQVVKSDYYGTRAARLDGDPYDASTWDADYVNGSGTPGTSILATFGCVFNWYDAACEAGLLSESEADCLAFLNGTANVGIMAQGDNAALLGVDGDLDRWTASLRYGIVTDTDTFLGSVAVETANGFEMMPDPTSYILGFWTPTRPIDAPLRGHWAAGWLNRQAVFSPSPLYETLTNIERTLTKTVLGTDIEAYARANAPILGDRRDVRSLVDEQFLLNPDVIHYLYSPEELSDDLRIQNFLTIEPTHYLSMFEGLKGATW